jgi:hypothetical protein
MARSELKIAASLLVVVLWPPSVWIAYWLTRAEHVSPPVEFVASGFTILPAVIALWWLLSPSAWWQKALITLFYIVAIMAVLFAISLPIVCARFGGCF